MRLKTLIPVLVLPFCLTPFTFGDADDTQNWPEPVYFPQKQVNSEKSSGIAAKQGEDQKKEGGLKHFWPFGSKASKEKPTDKLPQAETKTGPKDPPASPYPLVRIPLAFQTVQGTIPSGIYLLKPSPCNDEPAAENALSPCFSLTQRNNQRLVFQAHPVNLPDINMVKEGTPSPLSKANPAKPDPISVKIRISADQKTLVLQIQQGQNTLESETFPIFVDQRKILSY